MKKRLWSFLWQGGGFNSVFASSKEEAIELAKQFGKPRPHSTVNAYLIPDENTFSDDPERYHALCDMYAMD